MGKIKANEELVATPPVRSGSLSLVSSDIDVGSVYTVGIETKDVILANGDGNINTNGGVLIINFSCTYGANNWGANRVRARFIALVDGQTKGGQEIYFPECEAPYTNRPISFQTVVKDLPAGAHTLKIQVEVRDGFATGINSFTGIETPTVLTAYESAEGRK